jgi:hypothetical protein
MSGYWLAPAVVTFLAAIVAIVCLVWIRVSVLSRVDEARDELLREISVLNETLEGLRTYMYEIDPQFDEERNALAMAEHYDNCSVHKTYEDLLTNRKQDGRRMLATKFLADG